MPYTMKIDGIEEISKMLNEIGDKAEFVAAQGLYQGAGEMAQAISKAADAVKTEPFKYASHGETRLPSPEEKAILQANGAMGIAKFDKNGSEVTTSIGYNGTGYATVKWNHMSSSARTNYKAFSLKNHSANSSSFLKKLGLGKGSQNVKPIGVIANSINSGTSFMKKQPFFRRGMNAGKKTAESKIVETIKYLYDQIIQKNEDKSGGKTA